MRKSSQPNEGELRIMNAEGLLPFRWDFALKGAAKFYRESAYSSSSIIAARKKKPLAQLDLTKGELFN